MEKKFDKAFIDMMMAQAAENPRKRQNHDLRNSAADTSQRMMTALLPETLVPIHCHEDTAETVICLSGRLEELLYGEVTDANGEKSYREVSRTLLCPAEGVPGMQVPAGVWHSIVVLSPASSSRPKMEPTTPNTFCHND